MNEINFEQELATAKKAAKAAGSLLLNKKDTLNNLIFTSESSPKK